MLPATTEIGDGHSGRNFVIVAALVVVTIWGGLVPRLPGLAGKVSAARRLRRIARRSGDRPAQGGRAARTPNQPPGATPSTRPMPCS